MKRNISKKLEKRKKKIIKRLKKRNWENQPHPMLSASNIHYDIDGRNKGIANGGIGIIHQLTGKSGLINEIDKRLKLLKRHLPYHESDHVLNIAYNILAGGHCLEDIELLRNDEAWLDALDAEIIPDPTTAGDFLRRFDKHDITGLMEIKNTIRKQIWQQQPKNFLRQAVLNVDGTISPTDGECKEGMDISYDGQWGYHPLVVSLAKTREPLYIVNRSGNAPSHLDSAQWIDKSLDLVCDTFKKIRLRGDTDFSLTGNSDKWDQRYMVIASLAWDLKAWYGMLLPYRHIGLQIMRMEFKRFINTFIRIPCLIIKTGRRICYRLVGYSAKLKHTLNFSHILKSFSFQ